MTRSNAAIACAAATLLPGCYHATVVTGLAPGTEVVSKPWAHGFVYGLVPPGQVETTTCTNGVAKVETRQSFGNGLVSILTLGIYTPWQIDVTCAAPGPTATGQP